MFIAEDCCRSEATLDAALVWYQDASLSTSFKRIEETCDSRGSLTTCRASRNVTTRCAAGVSALIGTIAVLGICCWTLAGIAGACLERRRSSSARERRSILQLPRPQAPLEAGP